MKVTYVIGYRHTEDRYKNLTRTLDWLMIVTFKKKKIAKK